MIGPGSFILWIVVGIFAAISLFILVLVARVLLRRDRRPDPAPGTATHETRRELIWILAPVIAFTVVAVPSLRLLYFHNAIPPADLTIRITGKMWYWIYEYPDYSNFGFNSSMLSNAAAGNAPDLAPPATDNHGYDHIVVPVGKTVHVVAGDTDIIYSWAIPSIGAKIEALPGRTNQSWFKAAREGRYFGKCFELCGLPHAFKPVEIEVVSQERFDQWVTDARQRFASSDAPAGMSVGSDAR